MVIGNLSIDQVSKKIKVSVSVPTGNTVMQVLFWTKDTFKDYSKAIDLSYLLDSMFNVENFSITAEEVGLENFNGLFFLEFVSNAEIEIDNCVDASNTVLGIVANYIKYQECILDKVLSIEINNCEEVSNENCNECSENLLYINALYTGLRGATHFGYYEEAIRILNLLDELCETCDSCPEYEHTHLVNGYGYGTSDNSIIIM